MSIIHDALKKAELERLKQQDLERRAQMRDAGAHAVKPETEKIIAESRARQARYEQAVQQKTAESKTATVAVAMAMQKKKQESASQNTRQEISSGNTAVMDLPIGFKAPEAAPLPASGGARKAKEYLPRLGEQKPDALFRWGMILLGVLVAASLVFGIREYLRYTRTDALLQASVSAPAAAVPDLSTEQGVIEAVAQAVQPLPQQQTRAVPVPPAAQLPVPAARSAEAPVLENAQDNFTFTGIVDLGNGPMAVINDKFFRQGDVINGAKLLLIGEREVVLEKGGRQFTLLLY